MIEVKQAVQIARKFAKELYQDEDIQHLGLEEVMLDDTKHEWLVTLGYDSHRVKQTRPNMAFAKNMFADTIIEHLREYKTFRIDANDGSFHGIKMREVG